MRERVGKKTDEEGKDEENEGGEEIKREERKEYLLPSWRWIPRTHEGTTTLFLRIVTESFAKRAEAESE